MCSLGLSKTKSSQPDASPECLLPFAGLSAVKSANLRKCFGEQGNQLKGSSHRSHWGRSSAGEGFWLFRQASVAVFN